MKELLNKLNKEARKVSLRDSEKAAIRSVLLLRMDAPIASSGSFKKSPYWRVIASSIYVSRRAYVPVALAIVLIFGGSVSLVAEGTVPGDPLYSVKTSVNEELKSLIAMSPEAKAQFKAELVNERLVEAEKLAVRGELTQEKKDIIEQNIDKHVDEFTDSVNQITAANSQGALDATSDLESTLKAHETVLTHLATVNPSAESIVNTVQSEVSRVAGYREGVEGKAADAVASSSTKVANLEGNYQVVAKNIKDAKALLSTLPNNDSQKMKDLAKKIDDAELALLAGKTNLSVQAYAEALRDLAKANRTAKELNITFHTLASLNLNDILLSGPVEIPCATDNDCPLAYICSPALAATSTLPGFSLATSTASTTLDVGIASTTATSTPHISVCVLPSATSTSATSTDKATTTTE